MLWNQNYGNLMTSRPCPASSSPACTLVEYILKCMNDGFQTTQPVSSHLAISRVVHAFVDCLVCAAYANYHRERLPAALKPRNMYRTGADGLFREARDVQKLSRQIEIFHSHYPARAESMSGDPACNILRDLSLGLLQLQALDRAHDVSIGNDYLCQLIEDQTEESKESTKTSVQIGRLSRLAYVFLPLQITTALLGMNLEMFGSGNLKIGTFVAIFIGLGLLSFLPKMPHNRVSWCLRLWRYSRRVSFIYTCFCATHASESNDLLWGCGISWDLSCFGNPTVRKRNLHSPEEYELWPQTRQELAAKLKTDLLPFFPTFWQAKVNEIFEIIDQPRWGREKLHNP